MVLRCECVLEDHFASCSGGPTLPHFVGGGHGKLRPDDGGLGGEPIGPRPAMY